MIYTLADLVLRHVRAARTCRAEEPSHEQDRTLRTRGKATTVEHGPSPPHVSLDTDPLAADPMPTRDEPPSPEALVTLLTDATLRTAPMRALRKELTHDGHDS